MAYLQPQTLTCSQCDFRSEITWVVGVGPNSKPGDVPYRHVHKPGDFLRDDNARDTLICPKCGGTAL